VKFVYSVNNLILYISCTALGGAGAWVIYRIGGKIGLLDIANERSSHEGMVPKGGGIGVLVAFFACSIVLSVPVSVWIPTVLVSLLSLWGDRSEIKPRTRLLFQFAAGVALLIGVSWEKGGGLLGYALVPPLAIFVVGTANFYNFMDGINGIAGITGVVGFGMLSWFATVQGADPRIITLSLCVSLACLGFLPLNVPKAKVFVGDVGSILLGFVFAGMVVWLSKSLLDFVCVAAFLLPFYADEFTTLIVRIQDKDRLTRPHRKHLYQLLANEIGITHWKVSLGYGFGQLLVGVSVLFFMSSGLIPVLSIIFFYFFLFAVVTAAIRMRLTSKTA
jgi:Fuc2NAc and GlcNAc transferase